MKGKRIQKTRPRRTPRRDDSEPVSASFVDSCAHMELPSLAIVGRPNVGKSSLFNAILGRRQAIVHFDCGVTRDRVSASGVWHGRRFNLIDTGGLGMFENETNSVGKWDKLIAEQVAAAIEDAAAILFVVDVQVRSEERRTGCPPCSRSGRRACRRRGVGLRCRGRGGEAPPARQRRRE